MKARRVRGIRCLAFDPGIANTGYAVVERERGQFKAIDSGVLKRNKSYKKFNELQAVADIYLQAREIAVECQPDIIAMEAIFFHPRLTSAITTGEAIGARAVLPYNIDKACMVVKFNPQEVKAAVGLGHKASKQKAGILVQRIFKLDKIPMLSSFLRQFVCPVY